MLGPCSTGQYNLVYRSHCTLSWRLLPSGSLVLRCLLGACLSRQYRSAAWSAESPHAAAASGKVLLVWSPLLSAPAVAPSAIAAAVAGAGAGARAGAASSASGLLIVEGPSPAAAPLPCCACCCLMRLSSCCACCCCCSCWISSASARCEMVSSGGGGPASEASSSGPAGASTSCSLIRACPPLGHTAASSATSTCTASMHTPGLWGWG